MPAIKLILASGSPRRAEILTAAGIPFEVLAADVDESRLPGESPSEMVERLARAKAQAVAQNTSSFGPRLILGADTVVVCDDEILGKPANAADARRMLLKLNGREHHVITGFALLRTVDGEIRSGHETTRVWFSQMAEFQVDSYVASGEPMDKAGAYAIQGTDGRYIPKIQGCYFNVVGLPLACVWQAMTLLGWPQF